MHTFCAAGNIQSRSRLEYCAQRRTQADFRVHQAPEIKFLSYLISLQHLTNGQHQHFNTHNLKMRIKTMSKIKFHIFFLIFQNSKRLSCPWVRPGLRSIFSPEMFQKLILAESESTYPTVGLDKRKSQTNIRLLSTEPKRKKREPKKSAQDSASLAPATIE